MPPGERGPSLLLRLLAQVTDVCWHAGVVRANPSSLQHGEHLRLKSCGRLIHAGGDNGAAWGHAEKVKGRLPVVTGPVRLNPGGLKGTVDIHVHHIGFLYNAFPQSGMSRDRCF